MGLEIREEVVLAPFTTLGIGGPARYFAEARSEGELLQALAWASERLAPVFVLGGGSNVLIADSGWPGLVVRVAIRGVEGRGGEFLVGAGEDWDEFVALAVERDCAGVECLSGIPGLVGGTPVQNVGAYGQEVAETITSVRVLDRATREVSTLSHAECGFAYRTSIFNSTQQDKYIVLSVTFQLRPGGAAAVRYPDLRNSFAEGSQPTLREVRDAVRRIRAAKGMLIPSRNQPDDPDARSAGSFFKNPLLEESAYEALKANVAGCPVYPAGEGRVKLSAAWLIEHAGLGRGFGDGRVGISSKHTLALVNRGGATANDVIRFKSFVERAVRERFGIALQPEPVMIGF